MRSSSNTLGSNTPSSTSGRSRREESQKMKDATTGPAASDDRSSLQQQQVPQYQSRRGRQNPYQTSRDPDHDALLGGAHGGSGYEGASGPSDEEGESAALLGGRGQVTEDALDRMILAEQAARVARINHETTIVQGLFSRMQATVHAQDPQISRLEQMADQARQNTEAGAKELLHAKRSRDAAQQRWCLASFVLLCVGLVFLFNSAPSAALGSLLQQQGHSVGGGEPSAPQPHLIPHSTFSGVVASPGLMMPGQGATSANAGHGSGSAAAAAVAGTRVSDSGMGPPPPPETGPSGEEENGER